MFKMDSAKMKAKRAPRDVDQWKSFLNIWYGEYGSFRINKDNKWNSSIAETTDTFANMNIFSRILDVLNFVFMYFKPISAQDKKD